MKIQTKITIVAATIAILSTAVFGVTILKYFSPNNDGTRDVLEFPFSVKDDGRIVSWKMVIENSRGKVVRTIGNKVTLPSKISASEIFKQLAKPKESVIIPESVTWDGTMDDGTMAPDGEYFYYIVVTDEGENVSQTKKYNVFLDNTPPTATVVVPTEENLVFGEGNKSVFVIKQKGTQEKEWIGTISDINSNIVRKITYQNAKPQDFTWDGTDDKGMIVADGIYNYVLIGEDKAGNISEEYSIKNIIFSAEKPATNISISGSKYFSIPEKSSISSISFDVDIPEPKNVNKLVDWSVTIHNKDGKVVRTFNPKTTGKKSPLTKIEFDAKDDNGALIPEGEYFAKVTASYLNGYQTQPINTSMFVFDTTAPKASVAASEKIFSPDGDGRKDVIKFELFTDRLGGSPIVQWLGKIINTATNEVVFEYNFGGFCPTDIDWNGLDKNGQLCKDSNYIFELTGQDQAGNIVKATTLSEFALDTTKTEVMLAASDLIISPNGDGVQDDIVFTPIVKDNANVVKYNFEIKDDSGKVVYKDESSSKVPQKIIWNAKDVNNKTVKDGKYLASLTIESSNGSLSKVEVKGIYIDTVLPSVDLTFENEIFSPDGDSKKDSFVVNTKNCSKEDIWKIQIKDKNSKVVRDYNFNHYVADSVNAKFAWDGTDNAGNKVLDGSYSVTIFCEDKAGNKFSKTKSNIVLDSRPVKVFVTASYEGISPLSQTGLTAQKFNLRATPTDGIKNWKFEVVNINSSDKKNKTVYSIEMSEKNKNLPKEILWNGKTSDEKIAQGIFVGRLSMEYEKGNIVDEKSSSFVCSDKLPMLSVTTNPEFFSPDDDGTDDELFIKLAAKCQGKIAKWSFVIYNPDESGRSGKPFWTTGGTSKITETLTWNGLSNSFTEKNGQAERVQSAMDYPWEFTVTDSIGLTSTVRGKIFVDILVTRDGNVLKMAIPAIIFRSNHADFKTAKEAPGSKVTPEQAANNEKVLKRVADVLKKFPDYTVTVVGHANNITGTDAEETSTANGNIPLIPLSQDRAKFVKSKLESYGIESSRMTTEGKGGKERIAALKDKENWWKNRRVEFILHK